MWKRTLKTKYFLKRVFEWVVGDGYKIPIMKIVGWSGDGPPLVEVAPNSNIGYSMTKDKDLMDDMVGWHTLLVSQSFELKH